jgi:hypothetical protein
MKDISEMRVSTSKTQLQPNGGLPDTITMHSGLYF